MIFIDTNILVRVLVGDDIAMTQQARKFIERIRNSEIHGFIEDSVILEVLYVTTSKKLYGFNRAEIVDRLIPIIGLDHIFHSYKNELIESLNKFATTNLDFVHCLALVYKEAKVVNGIYSFDKKLGGK